MDERNLNQLSSPFGQNTNGIGINGSKHDDVVIRQYTMPGILHFLQTEWAKFEMERAQWEVERAELQVAYLHLKFQIFLQNFISYYKSCIKYFKSLYKCMN